MHLIAAHVRTHVMRRLLLALTVLGLAATAIPSAGAAPTFGETSTFALVGAPGHPDTSVIAPDGSVLVSTNRGARGSNGPSKIFRFSATGKAIRTYTISGQGSGDHGVMGLAFDSAGRLYVADYSPPRVLRIDLTTGTQRTYATVPDLAFCAVFVPGCDNGLKAAAPWPDGLAFLKDGTLLVTDLAQGTIFSVANGGGVAKPWLQDPLMRSVFGPNQLVLDRDGSLVFDVTASFAATTVGRGVIYRVSLAGGKPRGSLTQLFATNPGEGPDGFALGRSGRIYICTLVTDRLIVVEPNRTEGPSLQRLAGEEAFDSPSSATFQGKDLLVTNLTYFTDSQPHSRVLRVHVGDSAIPIPRPAVH